MLSVVLAILKFIGITILVILGLLLILAALVLFVPIRYKATGYYKDSYGVQAKASWLLHIVSFALFFEKDKPLSVKLKIFGITVYNNLKEKKKPEKQKDKRKKVEQEPTPELTASSVNEQKIPDTAIQEEKVIVEEAEEEHIAFFQKIKILFSKVMDFFRNIKYTFQKICDTIKDAKDNINYYLKLLQKDSTKAAFETCKTQLIRIGRNLKPKKFQLNLHIGMEDPATMGDILGVWGMFYPLHQGHIDICPDFEQPVMEGEFYCKGRITVYVYLWTLMIILFDKNIKRLRKRLVREGR